MFWIAATAVAFFIATGVAWALGPSTITWARRLQPNARPREDVPQTHLRKAGTPSIGGVFILPSACAGLAVVIWKPEAIGVALSMMLFGLLGLADDLRKIRSSRGRGLKAREKLVIQALGGAAMALYAHQVLGRPEGLSLPSGAIAHLGWGYYVLGALVAMAVTNAVNLTDGLDGLAAGSLVPTLLAATTVCLSVGPEACGVAAAAVAGACVGFLRFNLSPARIWMGDTGSLGLGGAVSALALFGGIEWFLVVAGFVLAAEALSVIIQVASFKTTGRRVFRMSPLHHHFELAGYGETAIVKGFWAASLAVSCLGVTLALLAR